MESDQEALRISIDFNIIYDGYVLWAKYGNCFFMAITSMYIITPWHRYHHHYFIDEETEAQRSS